MKRILHILFLAFVMAACTSPVETRFIASPDNMMHQRIAAIDSLMWQQPDSALAVMQDFIASPQADSLDAFDGHYCQLLVSELLYKNDCEQTNRAELLEVVDYFDSLCVTETAGRDAACHVSTHDDDIAFLTARTHYINGVGFYEQGEVVNACTEYLEALEVMEERFEEKELAGHRARFMAYTYNRLGDLFCNQYMMETAINCFEAALPYCKISPTSPEGVSRILNRIGMQYAMLKEFRLARQYYELALEQMHGDIDVFYRDIQSHIALCNYNLGLGMEQSIVNIRQLLSQTDKESERFARFLIIGSIYAEEKVYDSALVYLEPLFEHDGEIEAAKYLRVIYDSLGYTEKADACVRFLADNIQSEGENKALVSQLENVFKIYTNRKQQRQAEAEQELAQKKAVKRTLAVAVSVALLVLAVLVWVLRNRSKKRLAASEQELEAERQTHRMEQAAMSGRLKRSNQELRELKEQMKQQNDSAAKTEAAASFAEEPICRLIVERVKDGQFKSKVDYRIYEDSALDKQQLLDLRMAADRHFNQFTVRLKKDFPKLTNGDLDYCCLYLLGLTDADVSALMQKTYSTVSDRSRKLKNIFDKDNLLVHSLRQIAES